MEDGVVGVLGEGDGLAEVGCDFGDELTGRDVLVLEYAGSALPSSVSDQSPPPDRKRCGRKLTIVASRKW